MSAARLLTPDAPPNLLTAAAVALPALSGCTAVYGRIETGSGQSHLHPASERYVRDGLTAEGDDDYRAWLFTDAPETDPIATESDEGESLRSSMSETDDADAVGLLVEARMPFDERFHLTPAHAIDPAWTRLADVTLPMERFPVESDVGFESETVVATAFVRYDVRMPPRGATVHVYPEGGGRTGETVARVDARRP